MTTIVERLEALATRGDALEAKVTALIDLLVANGSPAAAAAVTALETNMSEAEVLVDAAMAAINPTT